MVVGFIGFGEAAFAIASGLREAGVEHMVAYDAFQNDAMKARAEQIGMQLLDSVQAVGERATLVFSLVTPTAALPAAADIAPALQSDAVYADLNSCSPKRKQEIAALLSNTGARFAGVAVMSAVPPLRHRVPMLADGPGAHLLKRWMEPYGMRIDVVEGGVGAAAAVKMCRSVIVKGIEALFMEALLAASAAGVVDDVLASVDASFGNMTLSELANYLLVRNGQHGQRRAHELLDAAETVSSLGHTPWVTRGAAERLAWSAAQQARGFRAENPQSFREVLEALSRTDGESMG
ncbi:dehydrogenase [Alicyclobacillus contaminans]|uniref:NAD(P)-dependent oxidoreductase n=1 Tax=Alicyclobacillus contaminans TaxID=392016 RepID=UPI0004202D34|nr:NAD(P)-dependent oxidoreductase [Alicyclobacillus contaminans]GMA49692.1 dehydrogenase [Alicyclobacillus contaminans]